jgi:hypothetical protein
MWLFRLSSQLQGTSVKLILTLNNSFLLNMHPSTLFLSFSHLWSISYFFLILYIGLIFLAKLYLLANLREFTHYNQFKSGSGLVFNYLTGFDLVGTLLPSLIVFWLINLAWSSPALLAWFGHLALSAIQYKVLYWILAWFVIVWVAYSTTFYFTSTEVYDYCIVTYFFAFWLLLLFYSTNLFSFIFFIEILSTLIILLLVTSTFSTAYFYSTTSFSEHTYFQQSFPFAFLQTLLFFFWISLVGSLNLFLFLLLFYAKVVTFDWFLVEVLFQYLISVGSLKDLFYVSLSWFNFLICIFLKCGLAPFYFWKPTFFKGMSMHSLFFYTFFFYFFLILYFTYVLLVLLNEVFYFNIFVNILLLTFGLVMLSFILFESYYLKAFFALSSILNTLLIFLSISSLTTIDFIFVL